LEISQCDTVNMNENIFLVVGLGNPGDEYVATRHNAGFMVVDELARRFGVSINQHRWQAYSTQLVLWGSKICLLKPDTYMNLSGKAVARYVDFYKVEPGKIIIIHDDLDMSPGRVKLVAGGGGTGGHNGIRSLVQWLGTSDFVRLKLGIGRPGKLNVHLGTPVDKYVLSPFLPDEKILLEHGMDSIEKGLEYLVRDGLAKAMNQINTTKS
jgi:peptidyl-tRNA hydrolase, PTH1 family